ncbi:hypothetical protein [Aeromicrobium sp. Leaf350]|uniref:hypothetical protein n=1 Tax=Aeromicrobium sp. Leaf350 TaxID=2876565 RepID=UPI001E35DAE9|nr:hypothetical protein [Aeromicrobium sp. Leaf350]
MIVERRLTLLPAAVALVLAAACGGTDGSDATPSPESSASPSAASGATEAAAEPGVRVEITITEDGTTPTGDRVDVGVGEPVTLVVTSEVTDEVHVHSDPEVSIDVAPGETVERTFTIDRPGQVAVESHESGATILQLVVQP